MLKSSTILLVRHAEKPSSASGGPGLSSAGEQRAQAYVDYFKRFRASSVDGSKTKTVDIQWVFACADDPGTSYRPRLTVSPFAESALLPFSPCVRDKDYASLATELYANKVYDRTDILICWHHGEIVELANALLTNNGTVRPPSLSAASCWPSKWPSTVFGWLLQICFDGSGKPDPSWVRCLNEKLMPDDTCDPCSLNKAEAT